MDSNKTAEATDEPISPIDDGSLEEKLQTQIDTPSVAVGFKYLFHYASLKDLLILAFCTDAAIAAGAIKFLGLSWSASPPFLSCLELESPRFQRAWLG